MLTNYLTIDVEDYFQVSAFEDIIAFEDWDGCISRVEVNTGKILAMLAQRNISATFFILGWTAEKYPHLVREIAGHGHEIGCHSYCHRLIYTLSPDQFREDTRKAKEILEQIIGRKVIGYRAPSYSITRKSLWALDILEELGFEYDSSIFPVYHDRYGIPDACRFSHQPEGCGLTEYPLSTSLCFGKNVPIAGGGYFRLFPYWFSKMAFKRINNTEEQPFIFYAHPWEFDPDQPRIGRPGILSRFRHYNNIHKMEQRFTSLLDDFAFTSIAMGNTKTGATPSSRPVL